MADRRSLTGLKVTMKKHPTCFRLSEPLNTLLETAEKERVCLYKGSVRGLCPLAPNNVNTMAAAAIAGLNLGLDGTVGRLVADPGLPDWHLVEVEVAGPVMEGGRQFQVKTTRMNPADPGVVTGSATYG